MPALAQNQAMVRDLEAKKTKSRNGCRRCKLKRLKCDETVPGCSQCKKRNVDCPGYEKTLKWSTKYEVYTPPQVQSSLFKPRSRPYVTSQASRYIGSSPSLNVMNGIVALAAVLPASKKNTVLRKNDIIKQVSPPVLSPPGLEEIIQESPTEDGYSPQDFEPYSTGDIDIVDPIMLNDLGDPIPFPYDEADLDTFESLDLDYGLFNDLPFDTEDVTQKQDTPPSLFTSNLTARQSSRESGSRLSRSLLLDFYRLLNPSPVPSSPDDVESLLIQHYFKDVCAVFSSFDSISNPFRTTIGRIYPESPSIKYAIQSMAAAHLANTFPNMAVIGVSLQHKARDALQAELPFAQGGQAKTFLSIMLLGLTTSWHDSSALGTEYLSAARSSILPKLLSCSGEMATQREARFFEESLIHWEMLMGFVTDVQMTTEDTMSYSPPSGLRSTRVFKNNASAARRTDGKIIPHPWTGVAPTVQFLFAEVGRLVRRERSLDRDSALDFLQKEENLYNATSLEEDLLATEIPSVAELADTGDERTPKEHFIVVAEAYRCAGLLELYRTFPSTLRKRLGSDKFGRIDIQDFQSPVPRFETPYEDTDVNIWLNSLAIHILQSIESLPSSSGTFCIQPLLFVVAASELKFVSSVDFFDVHVNDLKINSARDFVIRRLQEYSLRLPNKPLRQMIQIIQETWRRSDAGQDAFWIDVMNEKGWHTIM